MTSFEEDAVRGEREFESSLIAAGRRDTSSSDVEDAWQRLSSTLGLVIAGIEPTSGVRPLPHGTELTSGPSTALPLPSVPPPSAELTSISTATSSSIARSLAVKWVAGGALGGALLMGATTAAFLPSKPSAPKRETEAPVDAKTVLDPNHSSGSQSVAAPRKNAKPVPSPPTEAALRHDSVVAPAIELTDKTAPPGPTLAQRTQTQSDATVPSPNAPVSRTLAAHHLAGQVALLAEARRARPPQALVLVERFHRHFPKAALAPDAELIALRALSILGELDTLRARAANFLDRYPGDPHAVEVRVWLEPPNSRSR